MTALVVAEHDNHSLKVTTASAVAAAAQAGGDVTVLVAGFEAKAAAEAAAKIAGVTRVLLAEDAQLAEALPEALADVTAAAARATGASHIFFVSSSAAKAAMPRVAVALNAPAVTDITAVKAPDTFQRFIYAGGALATVRAEATPVVGTVRATAFAAAGEQAAAPVETMPVTVTSRGTRFVKLETVESDRPDLVTAKRVVAGGRGLFTEEGFAALDALAQKLGAAVGSTRAAVDMQLISNDTQVGQTGKIVAPELYFAFGISGAIQHVAGMKDSKVIVSVNTDPEAPIFEMSDFYLEADAVDVIRELTAKL